MAGPDSVNLAVSLNKGDDDDDYIYNGINSVTPPVVLRLCGPSLRCVFPGAGGDGAAEVFLFCTVSVASGVFPQYYLVKQSLTWLEAASYCKSQYTDLISTLSDLELLPVIATAGWNEAWIGLYLCSPGVWRWSNGVTGTYTKWNAGEPSQTVNSCVRMSAGKWSDADCGARVLLRVLQVIAMRGLSQTSILYLVETPMTWAQSRTFCRTHYTDLASITSIEEQTSIAAFLSNYIPNTGFWFGLKRNRFWGSWCWSGGQKWGKYVFWGESEPNDPISKPCGLISGDPSKNFTWGSECCGESLPFMCYGG
ncbi:putative C-type lectin domain family 20 member A [Anomaloglossus baeobatrachus]|uniref:putative C-type lectin domain family 20 member A n=1 Tax=Anomaloglossus baeobatrachus TaxID=238106 RepID=UPI003F50ADF5